MRQRLNLDLRHHRHTGKLLHHEHTSYRTLAVVFVIAGLFMAGLNVASRAAADDFGVSAMVEPPIPTNPPIISSPDVNAVVSGNSVLVTGSCPLVTPQVVVSVNVNGNPAGTGACDSNNDFSVPVTVSDGNSQITAGVLTITGQKGPVSKPIAINSLATSNPSPIAVTTAQPFTYVDSKDVTWSGTIGSGSGTDYVHVDWGDNSQSNYTVHAGSQSFTHHYATLASHNILLDVTNTTGSSTSEQFGAAAYTAYVAPAPTTSQQTPFFETSTVIGLYGLYLTALSIAGVIWLEAKHAARQHIAA